MARLPRTDPEAALEQVVELFWDRGYHDVCVEDIVHRTGLNRHSLYGRFGNKMGLFRAALDRYAAINTDAIDAVLAGAGTASARIENLLALRNSEDADGYWASVKTRGCMAARTADEMGRAHPELRETMDKLGRYVTEGLELVVTKGQQSGELRSDVSASELAALVVNSFMAPLAWDGSHVPATTLLQMIKA